MRLWIYLTLVVNAIILIAFLQFGAYSAQEQSKWRLLEIQRDTRNIASSLAAGAADDLLSDNLDKLEGQLLRLATIGTLKELLIADTQGRIVVRVRRRADGQFRGVYDAAQSRLAVDDAELLTENDYTTLAEIERGQTIGWVRVTTDLGALHEQRRHIWKDALISSLLTALFAGTLLVVILRRASRDMEKAAKFAFDLNNQRGNTLSVSSPILELKQLQDSLNEASHKLAIQFQELQDAEARKGATLEASLDCIVTIDDQGRIVDFNPAAVATFGYSREQAVGCLMGELIVPPAYRSAHAAGIRHYFATGEGSILHKRIEITAQRHDGSEFPIELSVVPFEGGGRQFFLGSIRDISERNALEVEQKRITNLLHQTVADLQIRQLALDEHAIVGITDLQGTITYANQKFAEISRYDLQELLGSNYRLLKSGLQDELYYRNMWSTVSSGRIWHGELANRRKDGELYWIAYTIVPMLDDAGLRTGYISIGTDITAQKNAEQALADARRRELETGHAIQQSLLFGDVPRDIHGAQLAAYTEPSQGIDGDFYAITRFRPDCFELLVGDVMGKGVPAALVGAGVKSNYHKVLAELFPRHSDSGALPTPAEIVNAMHSGLTKRLVELDTFVTLALYRFDIAAGTLTLVNAGHTPALLAHDSGGRVKLVSGDNLPLGVMADEVYVEKTIAIGNGDALLVFSDGITESVNDRREEFGLDRLTAILRTGRDATLPPTAQLQSIRQEVRRFVGSDILRDDQSALMVELQPQRIGPRSSIAHRLAPTLLILPWRLDGLEPLRRALPKVALRLTEEQSQAMLLASFEAATNVLRHARPYFDDATIACRMTQRDDAFSVELIYPGPSFSPPDDPHPDFSGDSEGGFGLYIIKNCVDSVEYASPAPGISSIRLVKRFESAGHGGGT